jgi:hypothetical protein
MILEKQLLHQRLILLIPLVLKSTLINFFIFIADRIQTVLQRSKPSSRISLIGEQPNLWSLVQFQVEISRHRGAKHPC